MSEPTSEPSPLSALWLPDESQVAFVGSSSFWGSESYHRPDPDREPTNEECSENAYVRQFDAYASWYPQMGGYIAKCWVIVHDSGCFDVIIYHDGEFPFNEDPEPSPAHLHHCDPDQFIRFGEEVKTMKSNREKSRGHA